MNNRHLTSAVLSILFYSIIVIGIHQLKIGDYVKGFVLGMLPLIIYLLIAEILKSLEDEN